MQNKTMGTNKIINLFEGKLTYLFGCNEHSADLCKVIKVDGIIDDFKAGSHFSGLPILHGDKIKQQSVVVNCVLMAKGRVARKRIGSLVCESIYEYSDLIKKFQLLAPIPQFMGDTLSDLQKSSGKWKYLEGLLSDEKSKKVLADIVHFRTTSNLHALADYDFTPEQQYFDEVVNLSHEEVFVDCGGFDGDTTEQFVKKNPVYQRVYLFEPSPLNMKKAKARLSSLNNINYIEKGVSDRNAIAYFNAAGGSASSITEQGSDQITLTKIDDEITGKITFIKMDLEGWETKAILGTKRHILQDHPKMAIAVYHSASDFWRIPQLVLGIRDDYDVYLRHYSQGWVETIMYFIPKKYHE
jgi:FkbM family methyltransferase